MKEEKHNWNKVYIQVGKNWHSNKNDVGTRVKEDFYRRNSGWFCYSKSTVIVGSLH